MKITPFDEVTLKEFVDSTKSEPYFAGKPRRKCLDDAFRHAGFTAPTDIFGLDTQTLAKLILQVHELEQKVLSPQVTCQKCDNYLPGHATGGHDICCCNTEASLALKIAYEGRSWPEACAAIYVALNPAPKFVQPPPAGFTPSPLPSWYSAPFEPKQQPGLSSKDLEFFD